MLAVKLDTGFNIEVEFPITPFHRRLFAWAIDLAVIVAYLIMFSKLLTAIYADWDQRFWRIFLYLLPVNLYHLVLEILMSGQTIGKKAMNIKVITLEGGQPTFSQYFIRWIFRILDCLPMSYVPGFFAIILSAKSQRLGDMVAGTIVIDTKPSTSWQDTIFTQLETTYKPRYQQVMQLSDKDINTLKSIIETVRKRSDYELAFRISERIQSRLNIRAEQEPYEFLVTLLKDYNYYSTN